MEKLSVRAEVLASVPLIFTRKKNTWELGKGFQFRLVKLEKKISGVSAPVMMGVCCRRSS